MSRGRRQAMLAPRGHLARWTTLALSVWVARAGGLHAQEPPLPDSVPPAADTLQVPDTARASDRAATGEAARGGPIVQAAPSAPGGVSPGGAFLRSVLVPGWGQAAARAPGRAAFYVFVQGANAWMIYKSDATLRAARRRRDQRLADLTEAFLGAGGDPAELEGVLEADDRLSGANDLVDSRSQQREDWIALGVFFLLLGGADAFVSAHLADFPDPLQIQAVAGPSGPAAEVSLRIPWSPGGLGRAPADEARLAR